MLHFLREESGADTAETGPLGKSGHPLAEFGRGSAPNFYDFATLKEGKRSRAPARRLAEFRVEVEVVEPAELAPR